MPQSPSAPLHLLHVFSTFDVGGQQTRFVTLVNELGRQFRHTVMAMDNRFGCAARLDPTMDWSTETLTVAKTASLSPGNLVRFRRILRRSRPHLLLTYNWGAIEWALANRWFSICRHLHFEDGFGPDESPVRQNPRRVLTRRIALTGKTQVIVPSRTLQDLATGVWHLGRARVLQVPNGIDCTRFEQPPDPALLEALGLRSEALVVGTVAALRREKNIGRLVRAFARLPRDRPYRLVIVGEGPDRVEIMASAEQLGLADRILLTGAIEKPERLLGRFDVFALSSDTEQMPYSILEAMAAGLPIVTTDVGDVKRMLAPENTPQVVPCADEAGLAAAMLGLLENAETRAMLGARNAERVRASYSLETMLKRYRALFLGAQPDERLQ
jgi:L-malate glycosyltransferase